MEKEDIRSHLEQPRWVYTVPRLGTSTWVSSSFWPHHTQYTIKIEDLDRGVLRSPISARIEMTINIECAKNIE